MPIQIISYHCNVKNRMGRLISSTIVRDVLLDPDHSNLPRRARSEGLRGIKKGETRSISIPAQDAYGLYDPKLVLTRFIEDSNLNSPLKIDEQVFVMKNGVRTQMRVIEFSSDTVTLDGNHPLAGQDLIFEILTLDARDATNDEILAAPIGQTFLH
ncbi:MAG: peptidylprolyl isomerase [Bdellovibrionota bacterium]